MAFTFNAVSGDGRVHEIPYPKEPVKIVAPKPVETRTEIRNLPRLRTIIYRALRSTHPRYKDCIKILFYSNGGCKVSFIDMDGDSDYYNLSDVHKVRIAVK